MKTKISILAILLTFSPLQAGGLRVDINRDANNTTTVTETGYVRWSPDNTNGTATGTNAVSRSFTTAAGENVTVTFAQTAESAAAGGTGLVSNWYKAGAEGAAKLVSDGLTVAPANLATGGQMRMTITGLNAGAHTLLTYHNAWDNLAAGSLGPIDISVNGVLVRDDLQPSIRAATNAAAATAYISFSVTGPADVTEILFAAGTNTAAGVTIRNAMINGFEIDTPNAERIAHTPTPVDAEGHANADSGSVTLSWSPAIAGGIASHDVYFGTDQAAVAAATRASSLFLGNQATTSRVVPAPAKHATYYWRIDEIDALGNVVTGTVWGFRPRLLAFPGAEGHGRFARGGRGGRVVHVTSLADYAAGDTPVPGTLRHAIEVETRPRVIVFDVSGLITLSRRLTLNSPLVTIAGQTAPGKGICLRQWPLGLSGADDCVVRFLRNRPGDISGQTIDGGGLAGCNHSIMDHCSISWSKDEAFSSRGAKNITLQNTLISEALAIAGHQNYPAGTDHGYAATVGGDIASLHHNLLAHCSGRNWSMGGGVDAAGYFSGRLDIRNNVVYNWRSRTTDGGAMEVNFVNNYYKPGAATTFVPYAVTMNHENDFGGSQRCYFAGNVMQGHFNEANQSAGRRSVVSNGAPTPTYETFVSTPFFEHHVTTQTATGAYKRVLSDVGANRPLDGHDTRVIQETLSGSYTYTGTGPYGGYPGLPNSQTDVGGWEEYPSMMRSADWDSDGDGLPSWWEVLHGTNPASPAGDLSEANSDPENDGFTRLDDYLAWMALPQVETSSGASVDFDLSTLTKGYAASPVRQVQLVPESTGAGTVQLLSDGKTVRFTAAAGFSGLARFNHTVSDSAGDSMGGEVGVRVIARDVSAFPGAEGFGRLASGGRGGDVYIVTNLNDSGLGSLRDAVTNRNATVPRTVVFAVSGTIYLSSTLRITKGNLTIAGQTAPGDGICLARYPLDPSDSSNVVIRFIRSRLGDVSGQENDAFSCRYAENVIVDHCSFSWSVDETASSYDNRNFTMQWCLISESLRDSVHSKGAHGYGAIWGGLGASFHHNLIAHHDSRNPRFNGAQTHGTDEEVVDMRNNVIYNWRGNSTYGGQPSDTGIQAHHNMVNNYYKSGPATPSGAIGYRLLDPTRNPLSTGPDLSLFHVSGNHTTASTAVSADNWAGGVQVVTAAEYPEMKAGSPFEAPPLITQSATGCYPLVLAHAGCRLPKRDTVDARVIYEVQNGTFTHRGSKGNSAGIIDSQEDVGGWPVLVSTPAPADSDSDGMPDAWESSRGLNPSNAVDRNLTNAEGYTNLELFLNELAAPAFPTPKIEAQPDSQTVTAGQGFSLSISVAGPGPVTYQWYRGDDAIEGATNASYAVEAASAANTGDYSVVVRNGYGSVRSAVASVTLGSLPPAIGAGPVSATALVGEMISFSVTATGTAPLSYQWYRGERAISGATTASYTLGPVELYDAGPYHVVVSNAHGAAISVVGTLTVTSMKETGMFSTGFGSDTIHAASPIVGPAATNWYVMSSKNATATSVGDDPSTGGVIDPRLDLTMAVTSSGIVETTARFATSPVSLGIGEALRLRVMLSTENVRTLGIGLFRSGTSLPHSGMMNSQLVGGSSNFASGGTKEWEGCRFHLDGSAASPSMVLERRLVQSGTTNAVQSLIVPGTSSSASSVQVIGSAGVPGFSWADNSSYTLTLMLDRSAADVVKVSSMIHAGTDVTVPAVGVASALVSPADLAEGIDALGIGYRNRDGSSVSHVRVMQVNVQKVEVLATVADPYEAFLAAYQLDGASDGLPAADPDADGVANALEFVLGGSPKSSGTLLLPVLEGGADGRFRFLRHMDASTVLDVVVESSTGLAGWTPLIDGVDGVTISRTPFDSTHEQIEVRLPASSASSRFLRLAASPKVGP